MLQFACYSVWVSAWSSSQPDLWTAKYPSVLIFPLKEQALALIPHSMRLEYYPSPYVSSSSRNLRGMMTLHRAFAAIPFVQGFQQIRWRWRANSVIVCSVRATGKSIGWWDFCCRGQITILPSGCPSVHHPPPATTVLCCPNGLRLLSNILVHNVGIKIWASCAWCSRSNLVRGISGCQHEKEHVHQSVPSTLFAFQHQAGCACWPKGKRAKMLG